MNMLRLKCNKNHTKNEDFDFFEGQGGEEGEEEEDLHF